MENKEKTVRNQVPEELNSKNKRIKKTTEKNEGKKKKRIHFFLFLVVFGIIGLSLLFYFYKRSHLSLNKINVTLATGTSEQIKISDNVKVKWKSSEPDVASVDENGVIRAIKKGSVKITATAMFKDISCQVKVEDPVLSEANVFVRVGVPEKVTLDGTELPITWTSDNFHVHVKDGLIIASAPCTANLSAKIKGKAFLIHVNCLSPYLKPSQKIKRGKEFTAILENAPLEKTDWQIQDKDMLEVVSSGMHTITLKANNIGKTVLRAVACGREYLQNVKINGKQDFSLSENNFLLNSDGVISLKNYIPAYSVKWEGASDNGNGTAKIDTSQRGTVHVKAEINTGIAKDTVEHDYRILEKVLNITNWEGYANQKFMLEMQDAEDPKYQCDSDIVSISGNEVTAVKEGTATIHVIDKETDLTCTVTIKKHSVSESMRNVAQIMVENGFTYSNSDTRKTLREAISESRVCNCALGVSYALQDAQYLPEGETIYYKDGLKGNGADSILNNPNIEVSYPDVKPKECNLQEGDVCGFMLSGGRVPHMAVFAGYSESGELLWYTMGRDATSGGDFNDIQKIGPRTQNYYNEVQILIRCK